MVMTFNEALARPEPRVGAWDYQSEGSRTLKVFAVGLSGAKLLTSHEAPSVEAREPLNDRLRERGIRIGGTHRDCDLVWVMDQRGAAIWSAAGLVAQGTQRDFGVGKTTISRSKIQLVETWFDEGNVGRRGVRCVLDDGSTFLVVEENDETHRLDPTYGRDNLDRDLEWAYFLGQDIAMWLDVPHRDQMTDRVTNERSRAVAGFCHELAARVEQTQDIGRFEAITAALGTYSNATSSLKFAPGVDERSSRALELRVTKAGNDYSKIVKQGSNAQIAGYLRQLRTPHALLMLAYELTK